MFLSSTPSRRICNLKAKRGSARLSCDFVGASANGHSDSKGMVLLRLGKHGPPDVPKGKGIQTVDNIVVLKINQINSRSHRRHKFCLDDPAVVNATMDDAGVFQAFHP